MKNIGWSISGMCVGFLSVSIYDRLGMLYCLCFVLLCFSVGLLIALSSKKPYGLNVGDTYFDDEDFTWRKRR
jgi:hypothetical protein